jgi:hypothetical protein
MATYRCWHYLCRETARMVYAASSHAARREMARILGVDAIDIVAQRVGQ